MHLSWLHCAEIALLFCPGRASSHYHTARLPRSSILAATLLVCTTLTSCILVFVSISSGWAGWLLIFHFAQLWEIHCRRWAALRTAKFSLQWTTCAAQAAINAFWCSSGQQLQQLQLQLSNKPDFANRSPQALLCIFQPDLTVKCIYQTFIWRPVHFCIQIHLCNSIPTF